MSGALAFIEAVHESVRILHELCKILMVSAKPWPVTKRPCPLAQNEQLWESPGDVGDRTEYGSAIKFLQPVQPAASAWPVCLYDEYCHMRR